MADDRTFTQEELSETAKRIEKLKEMREKQAQESIEEIRKFTEKAMKDTDKKELQPLIYGDDCTEAFQQFLSKEDSYNQLVKKSVTNEKVPIKKQERFFSKKQIALRVFTFTAIFSLFWPTVYEAADSINNYYPNHRMEQAFLDYEAIYESKENYSEFWTEKNGRHQLDHSHNWNHIMTELHASYPEPISAFYLVYSKLDSWCKKNAMADVFAAFNSVYGTNYHSLEDVLKEKGLENVKDLGQDAKEEFSRWEYRKDFNADESRDSSFGR